MYLKSHKWVDMPYTVYEIRRELRVRESCHTVMLFDRKYQDIDTGKYDSDKMQTINTRSLAQLIDGGDGYRHGRLDRDYEETHIYDFLRALKKKAVDEKIKKKREEREAIIEENNRLREIQLRIERKENARLRELRYAKEQKEREEHHVKIHKEWLEQKIAQDNALAAAEKRLQATYSKVEEQIYLGGPNSGERVGNIRQNSWRVK